MWLGKGQLLFTSLAILQCRGNFNASGCPEGSLCCSASRPHCCAIFLYLDAYTPVLGKNQTRLQTRFRQRPFAKYCVLQRYSKLYGKKKKTPSANTQPASTFRQKIWCWSWELTEEFLFFPGRLLSEVGLYQLSQQQMVVLWLAKGRWFSVIIFSSRSLSLDLWYSQSTYSLFQTQNGNPFNWIQWLFTCLCKIITALTLKPEHIVPS